MGARECQEEQGVRGQNTNREHVREGELAVAGAVIWSATVGRGRGIAGSWVG